LNMTFREFSIEVARVEKSRVISRTTQDSVFVAFPFTKRKQEPFGRLVWDLR
jgi:hypothetical protein